MSGVPSNNNNDNNNNPELELELELFDAAVAPNDAASYNPDDNTNQSNHNLRQNTIYHKKYRGNNITNPEDLDPCGICYEKIENILVHFLPGPKKLRHGVQIQNLR